MKMVEIKMASKVKELEKLEARLHRAEKKLEKAEAKVEKLGCKWTLEEFRAWMDTVETNENHFIVNKDDVKKNGAWFDWERAKDDVETIKSDIEKAEARLEQAEAEVEKYHKEVEEMQDLKKKEELQKKEFEEEVKEWAKDGIKLEARYYGETPQGKWFHIERNHGWTKRSRHCFTLRINGEVVFTSGEFWRAYSIVKNN